MGRVLLKGYSSGQYAGFLAIAIAAALPWSTSVTGILIAIWFLAYLPIFDLSAIRQELFTWRGGLPLVLFAFAATGTLWSDVTWAEKLRGLQEYQKLIFIPFTIAYFRHSEYGRPVIASFFISCTALLAAALIVTAWPEIQWWQSRYPGVPVKTYITQSAVFAICAFGLLYVAIDLWKQRAYGYSTAAMLLASVFLGDILFFITSRTELVVISVLVVLLCARLLGFKGLAIGLVTLGVLTVAAWNSSAYLRDRILATHEDIESYLAERAKPQAIEQGEITSTAYRIEFIRRSFEIIYSAPLLGHGTGSVNSKFVETATGETGVSAATTDRPHNQILAVAIQLGIVGAFILGAMWLAHALMFLNSGALPWFGVVLVTQIVVGSLFNDYLFAFTEGWLYVCGIGAIGGTWLREMDANRRFTWPDLGPNKHSQESCVCSVAQK